jgi:copper chaperone CopZ
MTLPLGGATGDRSAMRLRLTIDGMLAVHAKHALYTALGGVTGVRSAEVEVGGALLECEGRVDEAELRAAIEAVGFHLVRVVRELPTL